MVVAVALRATVFPTIPTHCTVVRSATATTGQMLEMRQRKEPRNKLRGISGSRRLGGGALHGASRLPHKHRCPACGGYKQKPKQASGNLTQGINAAKRSQYR